MNKAMHHIQDDRTATEWLTHTCFVKGRDTFMSGWGGAEGGTSYAVWCCRSQDLGAVLEWVKARTDMVNVTTNFNPDTYKLKRGDRLHMYVVDEGHPSLAANDDGCPPAWRG
jgi:hypothetical protein